MEKYYEPNWEDLFIGYEYEIAYRDPEFEKGKIFDGCNIDWVITHLNNKDARVRTKFLDQSDIESCGWIKDWDENSNYSDCYKLLTKSDINGQSDDEWVLWQYDKVLTIGNELSNRCFDGECKSINELRKIMEWLNIK